MESRMSTTKSFKIDKASRQQRSFEQSIFHFSSLALTLRRAIDNDKFEFENVSLNRHEMFSLFEILDSARRVENSLVETSPPMMLYQQCA